MTPPFPSQDPQAGTQQRGHSPGTRLSRAARTVTSWLTPAGWLVLISTAAGLATGAALGWVEGWFLGILSGTLLLIAVPFLFGSRTYTVRLATDRQRTVAGGQTEAVLTVQNDSARPALPALAELPVGDSQRDVRIPLLAGHTSHEHALTVATAHRGVLLLGPVTLARRDPLSLLRRTLTWDDRLSIIVHPVTTRIPQHGAGLVRDLEGQASRKLSDADLAFHAVRELTSGDSLRHVHWRSSAKTGTLMVRQYEQSQLARFAILHDALRHSYRDAAEFELAVSVSASLSAQAVRDGRERFVGSSWHRGRGRASADGLQELPSATLTRLLDGWAELGAVDHGPALSALSRRLGELRRDLSVLFLVTGSVPKLGELRRAAISLPPHVAVIAVRVERLAEPTLTHLDGITVLTLGELGDLGPMLARGGAR